MAVASTKTLWEMGEVQAQSAAKGASCKVGPLLGKAAPPPVRRARDRPGERGRMAPRARGGAACSRLASGVAGRAGRAGQ